MVNLRTPERLEAEASQLERKEFNILSSSVVQVAKDAIDTFEKANQIIVGPNDEKEQREKVLAYCLEQ